MPLTPTELTDRISARITDGRSFGRHPLWLQICAGELARERLQVFARQFFLQVIEFPRAVSALHTNCPYPDERLRLAENLYEEETGLLSGSAGHPELFLRFSRALGIDDAQMWKGKPLPGTAALIDWFELSSRNRSFVEGAAAITLAAEGQVVGNFGPFARALQDHYALDVEAVSFWDVHEIADVEHSAVGDHIVMRFATDDALQAQVLDAVDHSLAMWWQFFDGIQNEVA